MSTQINNYIVLGAKYTYDGFFEQVMKHKNIIRPEGERMHINDEYRSKAYEYVEDFIDSAFEGIKHHRGLCVINDGTCASYVVVGHVLKKTENYEHLGDPFLCSKIDKVQADLVSGAIAANFGIENADIGIWAFAHYR